jgi:hypothetical protein
MRSAYRTLVRKREGKRPLGRPRRKRENNIKMAVREIGWEDVDWVHLTQDWNQWLVLVNTVLELLIP